MPADGLVMVGSYDYRLVLVSVLISILDAYAALDLTARVSDARGRKWFAWLAIAATVDGIGTWSMHYTAMLAFRLPVPVLYHWPTALLSLLAGITGSAAAVAVRSRRRIGWPRALAAGVFLGGVGISVMHFIAMAAMRLHGMHHYSPILVILSVVLAIVISFLSVSLTFLDRGEGSRRRLRTHAGALLRGSANPVMHYIAMAAVTFTYSSEPPDLSHTVSIASLGDLAIGVVPILALITAILTSMVDRVERQMVLFDELFEQAPQAVALLSRDDRVIRVNRGFTRLFGFTARESIGRRLGDLIVPNESRDEDRRCAELVASGQSVDVEVVRRRKDGSRMHVSMVCVPVSLPGGEVETYAIFRDITERKRADEALHQYAERLRILSRRVVELQEEERRHLARELHDEIGQVLTTIGIHLYAAKGNCDAAAWPRLEECVKIVDEATQKVRDLSLDLRPSMLDDLGLAATLRWLVDRQVQRTGLAAHFAVESSGTPLPPDAAIACFRVAQEALTNVVRHAQARRVWVDLRQGDDQVDLAIRDDGVGFDPEDARGRAARGASLGLLGIQERIELLGGRIAIESGPMQGTTLRIWLPVASPPSTPDADEEGRR